MRLDSANRSFLALAGAGLLLGAYVVCGAVANMLEPLLLGRVAGHGLSGLVSVSLLPVFVFLALVAAGLGLAGRSLVRQMLAARRLSRRVGELAMDLPDELTRTAAQAGLQGRLILLDAPQRFSFVYGALAPRVIVSRGLLQGLSTAELRAVLEHERYHVANLDPLKILVARVLTAAFVLLPALDSLHSRYVASRELAADRRALRVCGRNVLARALMKVVRGPDWSELAVTAPIGDPGLLDIRVAQLETGAEPKLAGLSLTGALLSLLGLTLVFATFLVSVSSFGGPAVIDQATPGGPAVSALLSGLRCTAPVAGAGLLAYLLIALRASRPRAAAQAAPGPTARSS